MDILQYSVMMAFVQTDSIVIWESQFVDFCLLVSILAVKDLVQQRERVILCFV